MYKIWTAIDVIEKITKIFENVAVTSQLWRRQLKSS